MAIVGPRSINISWMIPETTNGNIIHYLVNVRRGSELITTNATRMNTEFAANNLSPFTNYTFEVAAVTSAGAGASVMIIAATQQDGERLFFFYFCHYF